VTTISSPRQSFYYVPNTRSFQACWNSVPCISLVYWLPVPSLGT
jgi:hypothetical protein